MILIFENWGVSHKRVFSWYKLGVTDKTKSKGASYKWGRLIHGTLRYIYIHIRRRNGRWRDPYWDNTLNYFISIMTAIYLRSLPLIMCAPKGGRG